MREARQVMADLAAAGLTPDQLALVMELAAAVSAEAVEIAFWFAEDGLEASPEQERGR